MFRSILFITLVVSALAARVAPNDERLWDEILPYTLRHVNESQCLDGSPMAYYFHPGNATTPVNPDLIIYFYGGGFCVDQGEGIEVEFAQINSCEKRRQDFFGSTNGYPETFSKQQGIMSCDRIDNDLFARAAKMWLMYCDGSLWFNQMNAQIFRQILQKDELSPTRVILVGSDVGSIYIQNSHQMLVDVIKEVYPNATPYIVLEGGLLMLSHNYEKDQEDEYYKNLQQVATRLNTTVEAILDWENLSTSQAKVFIIQPQYDWYQLTFSYGEDCHQNLNMQTCTPIEIDRLNGIRKAYVKQLVKFVKKHEGWGLWSIGCFWRDSLTWNEAYSDTTHRIPHTEGPNLVEALEKYLDNYKFNRWFDGEAFLNYDVSAWPHNKGCSHLKEDLFPEDKQQPSPWDNLLKPQPNNNDDVREIHDL